MAYININKTYNGFTTNLLTFSSNLILSKIQSFTKNSVPMPCIEPHCDIECSIIYESNNTDGIIRKESLNKIQQEHLMIDMGEDSIVKKLINFIPPPKTCLYRTDPQSSSNNTSNITIKFYPLLFGFVDHFLPNTIPRQVLINKQLKTVNQMCLPKKSKDFSDLIPGQTHTYGFIFENELDYRRIYGTAYFAVTMKKGGWDCNRHYEIISSGTIPFFDDLNNADNQTLSILPKPLLFEAQNIPGVFRHNLSINHNLFDINRYNLLLHRLLYYAKHRLTTVKMVEYILNVIKYPLDSSQKHSVLYIAHGSPDYMKEFMLHGFTSIFEENLHVADPPSYMYVYPMSKKWTYDETMNFYGQKLYGFGYGYKLTLKKYAKLFERDRAELSSQAIVENNIKAKNYSLIVFGSILRSNSLFSFTTQHYEPSRIVVIDGEDDGKYDVRSYYAKWGTYFLRETRENCDEFM